MAEEDVPRLGQLHPSRRSDKEGRSEFVLEAADLSAHCRLRDAQSVRCTSDVALLGDRHEILDLGEAHGGGTPSQLGYKGFPASVCTSRNHVVCNGIPRADEVLRPGDIINIDVTSGLGGFHGDTSATFIIGDASEEARHVVDVARRCRDAGIATIRDGARLGDIGAAVAELAERLGCSVVRDYGGHGIGRQMHMEPHVPHFGRRGSGLRLRAGMALTVEPMINLGAPEVRTLDDGWTVVTADGRLSAQFEHTVLVTREGVEILTSAPYERTST